MLNGVGRASGAVDLDSRQERRLMSDHKQPPAKVPDGVTRYLTTRQMAPNEKGFVGFETIWKPFQKEVQYKTPKKP
jgi:hypothetical protein